MRLVWQELVAFFGDALQKIGFDVVADGLAAMRIARKRNCQFRQQSRIA